LRTINYIDSFIKDQEQWELFLTFGCHLPHW
jgi:hypothetical protein